MATNPEQLVTDEFKSVLGLDVRNNGVWRERVTQKSGPLEIGDLSTSGEKGIAVSDEFRCLVSEIGWTNRQDAIEGRSQRDEMFTGLEADKNFRDVFFQDSETLGPLSNFLALFRQTPTLDPHLYQDISTAARATKPAINRLFLLDPTLFENVGRIEAILKSGLDLKGSTQAVLANFDRHDPERGDYNDAVTVLRQAFMLYRRLVKPTDEARQGELLGGHRFTDDEAAKRLITNIDYYALS